MGRELPAYPTLFAKFANALLGANDDIVLPRVSSQVDWEAELGVVIGRPVRLASAAAIAGVGAGREPPVFLRDGQKLVTTIEGLGQLSNYCVAEPAETR
jgi:2-keto-4-pentenoate hydratase/2-oxohepta-3-ene-1,7-dioic acid hydratase in catechol pathway